MTSGSPKEMLRREWRPRRAALLGAAAAPLLAEAHACVPPLVPMGKRLGIYWPLAGEVDLRPLAQSLPGQLALPAVLDGSLIYRAWGPGTAMALDACGIPAPAQAPPLGPEELALLLVPALAFDRCGLRLGSGGGWYDRLRAQPRWAAVPALIVAPEGCAISKLPAERWDVPFGGWLSETGLHWLQGV